MKKRIFNMIVLILLIKISFSQNMDIPEKVINSTTHIKLLKPDGKLNSSGTGFYFRFMFKFYKDTISVPVIVTNYHVLENAFKNNYYIKLTFNKVKGNEPDLGNKISYDLLFNKYPWQKDLLIRHPDTNIDLAIILLQPIIDIIEKQNNYKPYFICYNEEDIPNANFLNNLTAIEEVFMIGYPKSIFDDSNYLPIVRRGITATSINHNYRYKNQFLLDISVYPGSSGSPVILYKNGTIIDKRGNVSIGRTQFALLGIVSALYNPYNQVDSNLNIRLPINLAIVIKSKEILGFKPLIEKLINGNKNNFNSYFKKFK